MSVVQIHPAVYRIETPFGDGGTVFLYLLKGDSLALVDTGASDSPRRVLQPALAEIGIALSDVDLILNTHAHLDHAGGNTATRQISNATIYVHAADLGMARSTEAQVEFMTAPLRALEFPETMVQARSEYIRRMAGEGAGADVILQGGEIVDLGGGIRLRVIHNPGHTPGCVSFYWESEGLLITGDAVQGQGSRPGIYPLYFDASNYRRSLTALNELDYRLLCLEHAYEGGSVLNNPTKNLAEGQAFFSESMRVADAIHAAIAGAIRERPGASKREIALAALSELIYEFPQVRVRASDMPVSAPCLAAHIDAVAAGTYPV